jgi:23S rRNA pseudouridine2605 synthase
VNGEVATLGRRVHGESDAIDVDGVAIPTAPGLVHYVLNKPRGVVSTSSDPEGRPTVVEFVPEAPRVFSVGRLDFDTEGLLIMTNDGRFTQLLSHPSFGVEKEYLAEITGGPLSPHLLRQLRSGVELDDGVTAPAKVSEVAPGMVRIAIHEGRNRQVRRMFSAVGREVIRLVRVRIGGLQDQTLRPGSFRSLSLDEVLALSALATNGAPDRRSRAERRSNLQQ